MPEEIIPDNKFELMDYLQALDLDDSQMLEIKSDEIMGHVQRIIEPYAKSNTISHRDYYGPIYARIKHARKIRDFKNEFPRALEKLIFLISIA